MDKLFYPTCVIDLMRIGLRLRNPNIDSDGFGNIK